MAMAICPSCSCLIELVVESETALQHVEITGFL